MKRRSSRLNLTVSHEMTVALEMLSAKTGLALGTQAMIVLRQALDRTIQSEAAQLRIAQDRAFRTRDEWLADQTTDTYVSRALAAAEGESEDAPPV